MILSEDQLKEICRTNKITINVNGDEVNLVPGLIAQIFSERETFRAVIKTHMELIKELMKEIEDELTEQSHADRTSGERS